MHGFQWHSPIWASIRLQPKASMIASGTNFKILIGYERRSKKRKRTEIYARSWSKSMKFLHLFNHRRIVIHQHHHLRLKNLCQPKSKRVHLKRMWLLQMKSPRQNHLQASSSMSEWPQSSIPTTCMRSRCRRHGASTEWKSGSWRLPVRIGKKRLGSTKPTFLQNPSKKSEARALY